MKGWAMEVEIRVSCTEGVKHAVRVVHSLLLMLSNYYEGLVNTLREV